MSGAEKAGAPYAQQTLGWFRSRWFRLSLGVMAGLAVLTGVWTGAPMTYVMGQALLVTSVYVSLWFLANRPLINPIQALVGMFYWWFGIGPTIEAAWNILFGRPEVALQVQVSGMESLWIVAPGLLLYAVIAKLTLRLFSKTIVPAKFLLPSRENYRPKVLIAYLLLMGLGLGLLAVLGSVGIQGQEETSFFGGTKTTIWWVGVIAATASIAPFVSSSLMMESANPWRDIPTLLKILIVIVIVQTVVSTLFSGWKGPIAFLGAYYVIAYISRYQQPPWFFGIVGTFVFLIIIAPYVAFGRQTALAAQADNSAMRKQIFAEVLKNPTEFIPAAAQSVNISILFRGIYPIAGELTRRNGFIEGEWHGDTVWWGLETLVPRALSPNKRDSNIGNFFSKTVGADIGMSNADDDLNNIAISIPFEILGNFGWGAGILSFGFIAFGWTLLVMWILSPSRLSTHPLTPYFAMVSMGMERPLGSYLAGIRGLIIPMFLCYIIYRLFNKKI